jgi:hypothetical protein
MMLDAQLQMATRAAHSLRLASQSACTALLASVQRVGMASPLPAILRQMASLASLHAAGAEPLDRFQLRRLIPRLLRANQSSSPQICQLSCSSPGYRSCSWTSTLLLMLRA